MYWLPRENVLVPTDFSEAAADAIHTALAMVEYERNVHILHGLEPVPDDLNGGALSSAFDRECCEADRLESCRARLAAFLAKLELQGLTTVIQVSEPVLCVTRYA